MDKNNPKKTSIFWKLFWGILFIAISSNIIFVYIIYNAYEGIMVQVRPFLDPSFFDKIEVSINSTWLIAASAFLFVIVMAILFTILLTGRILKPMKNLLDTVQEVGKGNLDAQATIKSRDEIGDLANEFNLMIDKLKVAREAIQEEKNILEIKVRARTNELQELAQTLDDKIKERTKELQARLEELERFHRLTVGRELKMLDLKKENEKLRKRDNS